MSDEIKDMHDELFNRMVQSVSIVFGVDLPFESFTPPEPHKSTEDNIASEQLEPRQPNYEPVITYQG